MRPFAIGGTGRSGTKWCATALRNGGIYCGHEQVFATAMLPHHHAPRWVAFDGDSSLAAVPYFEDLPHATKILVVRDPYTFVSSMLKAGPLMAGSQPAGLTEYLYAQFPDIFESANEPEAAMRYWVHWNRLGARYADHLFRLEELVPGDLFSAIGVEPKWHQYPIGIVNHAPNYAKGEYDVDCIDDRLRQEAEDLAFEFGYEWQ